MTYTLSISSVLEIGNLAFNQKQMFDSSAHAKEEMMQREKEKEKELGYRVEKETRVCLTKKMIAMADLRQRLRMSDFR